MSKFWQLIKSSLNKDLLFTGINQLWRLVSGPLTLIFIPLFLSKETQGYWFTFTSLSALSVFADLGFTNIVLQFSAHEFAYLAFDQDFKAYGDEYHLKKLASFFMLTVKWALLMIGIVFPIILGIGFWMFMEKHTKVMWSIPWVIYLIGATISFLNTSILSFIEGCNLVGKVQKVRFEIAVINTVIILSGLYFGFQLYALALGLFISSSLVFIYLSRTFGRFLKQLVTLAKTFTYFWKSEFFSLLWRYAISFSSGYFIFQIYTPLMFKYQGAIEAGKVGISMALWNAVFSISNVWIYTVTPKMNFFASKRNWGDLNRIFRKNLILSLLTFFLGTTTIFFLFILFEGKLELVDRFLGLPAMLCLSFSWLMQLIINSLAVYLRAHKQEPLVVPSVVSAIYILFATLLCAQYLSADYLFLGFASSYLWGLPWVLQIFNNKRKMWHNNELS